MPKVPEKAQKGKYKVVTSFPDYKVQVVTSFPDMKVQKVTSFPDKVGKWQEVTSFPDFTVNFGRNLLILLLGSVGDEFS
jgi:hypothetical protein